MNEETKVIRFGYSDHLITAVCEAAGIDAARCSRIVITLEPASVITVEATMFPSPDIEAIDWEAELGDPTEPPKTEGEHSER